MTRVRCVLAPNPGPFTLEGTNTWLVGGDPCLVIDPGPEDRGHLEAVAGRAGRIGAILLTHHHPDHAPGAAMLAELSGAPVLAFGPWPGEGPLEDGRIVTADGVALRVLHTPGHSRDHAAFHDPGAETLFTGDSVLGRGTSVVDPPDGDLAEYMRSLRSMAALAPRVLYPGHGPVVEDGTGKLREYLEHRDLRERQVLGALGGGPRTPEELVPGIYAEYPTELYPAAARSVLAHLEKLEGEGRVVRSSGGERFGLAPAGHHGSASVEEGHTE